MPDNWLVGKPQKPRTLLAMTSSKGHVEEN